MDIPDWIDPEAWNGYQDMRKGMKKPMTPRAESLVLKTLERLKNAGHDPNESLDQSTVHNWIDVYQPKPKEIENMKRETYRAEPRMTAEEKAKADHARQAVMAKATSWLRRVA